MWNVYLVKGVGNRDEGRPQGNWGNFAWERM